MADRKHTSNIALPSSSSLSSSTSQLFQPHQMMPSIEAYLEAYQTLLGAGRDPTANALSAAFPGNYPLRHIGGLPMTSMPFVPPSYFTFPSFPMDMSPYGLMSPVMIPPFFTSLYCDPSASGTAAALGRASMTADYRDSAAGKFISSALSSTNEKDEMKSRPSADIKENISSKSFSAVPLPTLSGTSSKKDSVSSMSTHSNVRTSNKSTSHAKQHHQLQTHHHATPKNTQYSSSSSHVFAADDFSPKVSRHGLPGTSNSDKSKARPLNSLPVYNSLDQDSVPIDFSSSAPGRANMVVPTVEATSTQKHARSSSELAETVVHSRASVVVAPPPSDRLARPANGVVVNQPMLDTKSSMYRFPSNTNDLKPLNTAKPQQQPGSGEHRKAPENGLTPINFSNNSKTSPSSSSSSPPHPQLSFNQQPLRLDANTLSLLKNVNCDSAPLVRHDLPPSGVGTSGPSTLLLSGSSSRQQQLVSIDAADKMTQQTASNESTRRRAPRSERKQKIETPLALSVATADLVASASPLAVPTSVTLTTTAVPLPTAVSATAASGTAAGVEEFRCSLCNYSGRSQHCLTKHMRAHDVAYKICQYCRRAFERPSDLLRHEERHRRRDVSGSSPLAGGALPTATTATNAGGLQQQQSATTSASVGVDVASSSLTSCVMSVGRVDSYSGGSLDWTNLVAVGVGTGDNEVVLDIENLPSVANQASSRPPPEPSKFRDVYSIMAGIVVAQSLAAINSGKAPSEPIIPVVDVTALSTFQRLDDQVIDNIVVQSNAPIAEESSFISAVRADGEVPVDKCHDDISSDATASSKLEFLRKLELEKAGSDAAATRLVENTGLSRLALDYLERKSRNTVDSSKRRRKGRPLKADVSSLEPTADKNIDTVVRRNGAEGDGTMVSSENADSAPENSLSKRTKMCGPSIENCDDVETEEVIPTKKICFEVDPDTTSDVVDLSAGGQVRRVSNVVNAKSNRRDAIIGKLVVRSRLFQRRRAAASVQRTTPNTRVNGSKVDSNGNALTQKPIGRRSRRFASTTIDNSICDLSQRAANATHASNVAL